MRLIAMALAVCCSIVAAYADELPACDAAPVLSELRARQAWAEANTWKDGVTIAAIDHVVEHKPVAINFSVIERRHCRARASLSDRRTMPLYFMISAGGGMSGTGWNVEFCLDGHDPYRVFGNACQVLK